MRSRNFGAAGDGAVVGVLQVLLFDRADIACAINRRRGMSVRRDAAHDRPPASRRTVDGALFVAGIRPRATPEYSGWTRFRFAASGLRGTRGRDHEGQHTACAAISFKHHKELFSETLPRNLP
jgi:hypothetical protein